MLSTYQNELLFKIETKYGRNNSFNNNLDGRQWMLFVYLPGMIALLPICITLIFLPRLPALCVTKEMSPYHLLTCDVLHGDTESSRYWEARGLLGR
ncbi:hypothetical protein NPIL_304621 [Nephila pilipes]|uniref:Uncharacterized protein n=1 Tax=Nephila pilipes TaxID=299642 RepID=A0A8X6PD46_NEPPI|nr:hypothetical protein NPIL_304621 [Nephila pilipes]